MLLVLLILLPILFSIIIFLAQQSKLAKPIAILSSLIGLGLAVGLSSCFLEGNTISYIAKWIPSLGANIDLQLSSMSILMVLLIQIIFTLVFVALLRSEKFTDFRFYGLMLLAQAGLLGVFLAYDLLLFYFFWELALIPVYFLCSQWGGENRIKVTFKFFVYTFLGSLIMLGGIVYLYIQNPNKTFDINSIIATANALDTCTQQVIFWMFFVAFAIKMPIFPFHTWQPDAYQQSATPVTIVLSALMVKMGLFATYKWVMPLFPQAVDHFADLIIIISLVGLVYGSFIAMVQTDVKRLIAYSSIAHIALMNVGIFINNDIATNGLIVQMFNHGINIAAMWLIINMVEDRYQTTDFRNMGGLASVAPKLTIALVVVAFANISLPLTNAFVGEFMLFHGIFSSDNPNHIAYMVIAGLGIILGAIYTLNMVQKVAFGTVDESKHIKDISTNELLVLAVLIIIIIVTGVYPEALYMFLGK
jgi:NADH-quinone oxidoreductase subunit M